MLQYCSSFDPAEAAERVPNQTEGSIRQLFIGHDQVTLEIPAPGTKRPHAPVEPARAVDVDGIGTDVGEDVAQATALERTERTEDQVVAQEITHDEAKPLRAAVSRNKHGLTRGNVECHAATIWLAGSLAPGGVLLCGPGPRPCRRTRVEAKAVLVGGGVPGISIEIPTQVVKPAHQQSTAIWKGNRIEGSTPGGSFTPSLPQGVHRENIQHAVAVRGEVDPAVAAPGWALVNPVSHCQLADTPTREIQHEEIHRAVQAPCGPVGGKHDAAAIRAGTGIEVLETIAGQRLERTLGQTDPVEVGNTAFGEPTENNAPAVGHPHRRQNGDQFVELVPPSNLFPLQVPDYQRVTVAVADGK